MKKVMYLLGCIVGFIVVAYIQSLYVNLGVSHTSDYFLSKGYIILSVAALLLILVSGIYLNITKFSIVKIYPFVMLIFGLGCFSCHVCA